MRSAQQTIIETIQSDEPTPSQELCLYRGIADAIAWQILGGQLCHARRLFKGHAQPNLKNCNFESTVAVINECIKEKPDSIPLICDLTSFIQVGDILSLDPNGGISMYEVKEGAVNKRIIEFMHFFLEHQCERSLQFFALKEGEKAFEQLGRMIRQTARMAHFKEILNKGTGHDPDTNVKVTIPDDFIQIDLWDDALNETIENSQSKGWAINIIDNCLFVGCYSEHTMRSAGHVIFNGWFESCGGNSQCPRGRMIDSMLIPLALPLFNRAIPSEMIFDLLFGRKQICMGIVIEALLKECERVGLSVRLASKKETSSFVQSGNMPFKYNNRAIFICNGKNELVLGGGLFLRTLFHGQKPISLLQAILSNLQMGNT